jgi:hypothetical protein
MTRAQQWWLAFGVGLVACSLLVAAACSRPGPHPEPKRTVPITMCWSPEQPGCQPTAPRSIP